MSGPLLISSPECNNAVSKLMSNKLTINIIEKTAGIEKIK